MLRRRTATSVLVYSYFLAHAAGSGGCDNDIKSSFSGDSSKSIVFRSIRGGGRGSGGVILYEKNMATDLVPVILPGKRKKYSTSPEKRIAYSSSTRLRNNNHAHILNGAFVDMNNLRPLLSRLLCWRR